MDTLDKAMKKLVEALSEIVNDGRPYADKAALVKEYIRTNGNEIDFGEFLYWFDPK